MDNLNTEIKKENNSKLHLILNIILGVCFIAIISYYFFFAPTRANDVVLHISQNESLTSISKELESKGIVRHSFVLKFAVSLLSSDRNIKTGDYLFKKDKSLLSVAWQISRGNHGVEKIKVTLTEGMTNEDMADILSKKITTFRKDLFLSDPRSKQGYLFPDTYFFFPMTTTDEILVEMTSNFSKRINSLEKDIENSGKDLSEIITMASILEKEANGKEDSPLIAGILWKRIKLGMPLQVDAAPITYKEGGLPDSPISNPGLLSIKGAINPKESPYLFYLHDHDGQVHFAMNFNEHRDNIKRYLK